MKIAFVSVLSCALFVCCVLVLLYASTVPERVPLSLEWAIAIGQGMMSDLASGFLFIIILVLCAFVSILGAVGIVSFFGRKTLP